MKLLKNCSLIVEDKILNQDIVIDADTIVKIYNHIEKEKDYEVVDLDYKFVLPGFIDIHVHLDDEINGAQISD